MATSPPRTPQSKVAIDALSELVKDDPDEADQLVLVTFDDTGEPAGEPGIRIVLNAPA